jgi:hypothetical protein
MSQDHIQDSDETYFEQLPDYPEQVTPVTTLARMIEGLGYRFHWASKDLNPQDLSYRPSEDGKTTYETLQHILELTQVVKNVVHGVPNESPVVNIDLEFEPLRQRCLKNLREASELLRAQPGVDIESFQVVFKRGETERRFPFWNLINGQLSDAIYHTGQLVVFRRASGNPIDSRVNVFTGINRE